jgi:hypothetical protein
MTAETAKASTTHEPFSYKNPLWHTKGLQLPAYIQHIAHDLLEGGRAKSEQQAIAMAVGIVKKWAAGIPTGGGSKSKHVHPDVRAAAARAVAEWERARATAHAHSNIGGDDVTTVDLARRKRSAAADGPDTEPDSDPDDTGDTGNGNPVKSKLISHLRNVHRLTGSHEHSTLPKLHERHANDHAVGGVPAHHHHHTIEPRHRRPAPSPTTLSHDYGESIRFDPWGNRVDLAIEQHGYIGFAKLVHRLQKKGRSKEEAKRIAAFIGRRKYGAKAFANMAQRGQHAG